MLKPKQLLVASAADYLTVGEVAVELRVKETAIRNYLAWGKMTTFKFKTLTLISKREVEDWKKRQKAA